jgi:tight adherence protein B
MVATDGPRAVAGEFQRVFEEHRFGLPFTDALMGLADRIEIPDVRIFVTAILVQRETGGNLAEILEKIATTLRARFTLRRQLRVYTAQGRLTGMVLMALPAILAMGIYALDPSYMTVLVEETIGLFMLGTAAVLQVIGLFWIRHIINIDI